MSFQLMDTNIQITRSWVEYFRGIGKHPQHVFLFCFKKNRNMFLQNSTFFSSSNYPVKINLNCWSKQHIKYPKLSKKIVEWMNKIHWSNIKQCRNGYKSQLVCMRMRVKSEGGAYDVWGGTTLIGLEGWWKNIQWGRSNLSCLPLSKLFKRFHTITGHTHISREMLLNLRLTPTFSVIDRIRMHNGGILGHRG